MSAACYFLQKKSKVKAAGKKSAKGIREIQELVAKGIEREEIKAKEEEERRRKEEEDRQREEEKKRQAEEAKRRKKDKEKEKILKKKQDGTYLTPKQKMEQQRLESFRKQILGDNSGLPVGDKGEAAPTKRPIYKSKKSKPAHKQAISSTSAVNAVEDEEMEKEGQVEDVETEKVEEEVEKGAEVEDEGDEAWDAKNWDDVSLTVKGAFDDEEVDSDPEPTVKKDAKTVMVATRVAGFFHRLLCIETNEVQEVQTRQNQPGSRMKASGVAETGGSTSDVEENLRSPICCIMGHVDTGKTKLLDCIRGTNVQEGEAGGITQQIGATYFPAENIRDRTKELKADAKLKVPGLLVIDTPGHESFKNLRSRGSGLCDIAVLVVDIMHGLEPQTIESLDLLKMRNTEFIVALNKVVDRLHGWKVCRNAPIRKAIKQQSKDVQDQFKMMVKQIIFQFQEQGLNTALYYNNKEMGETYSIVPTSAISGEGIPDLLLLLVQWAQKTMVDKLTFSNEIQCTVLEVKVIEGHGTTIDVVLVNGVLHEGEQIVICGLQGPIVTTIRALLTPHPMKELRVKGTYLHHKSIKAAQGIKISAQGLEHSIAGTGLYVVGSDDDLEDVKESAMEDMKSVMSRIDRSGEGVYVQASTLGSLEALLEFLKSPAVKIPVSGIGIGPVHKKDVMKASVMLGKKKEYATILAFDVKVTPEAQELADGSGVKIFIADIIYHLFDQFKAYIDKLKEEKRKEAADEAVFPCVMKINPAYIFYNKDPIVLGVDIVEGIAKVGTPICIPSQDFIDIGRISSIHHDHKSLNTAKKGQQVAIKIEGSNSEEKQKMYGRHFDSDDELVSRISRRSIDSLKENYRDDLSSEEWKLVVKLKNILKIQ
ncbi:Eukaryotic translation initiation factor 5B [Linum perenne]